MIMERTLVSSSDIASIGYDEDVEILEVEFLKGGVYIYKGVPKVLFEGLINAQSIGSFFSREIKSAFPYEKVG